VLKLEEQRQKGVTDFITIVIKQCNLVPWTHWPNDLVSMGWGIGRSPSIFHLMDWICIAQTNLCIYSATVT